MTHAYTLDEKPAKAKLYLLKGKVLDILEEYSKEAEDALSKSVSITTIYHPSYHS